MFVFFFSPFVTCCLAAMPSATKYCVWFRRGLLHHGGRRKRGHGCQHTWASHATVVVFCYGDFALRYNISVTFRLVTVVCVTFKNSVTIFYAAFRPLTRCFALLFIPLLYFMLRFVPSHHIFQSCLEPSKAYNTGICLRTRYHALLKKDKQHKLP